MVAKASSLYESDQGAFHSILLEPNTLAAAGTPPTPGTGVTVSNIKAKITKGNREFGIRPRGVLLSRTIGTAPDTFKKYKFLPVLTASDFNAPGFAIGGSITIDGVVWVIIAKRPEDY